MNTMLTAQQALTLIDSKQFNRLKLAKISPNFTWGEVFTNRTDEAIATITTAQINNAVKLSLELENLRVAFGNVPIAINSWWRDKASNASVGGAKNSFHLQGLAADIRVQGLTPKQVQQRIRDRGLWAGGIGLYTEFTHLDLRPVKGLFPLIF